MHQIHVYGRNGLNAQSVTFSFNNNSCLDFLLVVKEGWWVQPTDPASYAVGFLWIAGVLDSCWNVRREGFFRVCFQKWHSKHSSQDSCCHTLGSFGQPHKFSQVIYNNMVWWSWSAQQFTVICATSCIWCGYQVMEFLLWRAYMLSWPRTISKCDVEDCKSRIWSPFYLFKI